MSPVKTLSAILNGRSGISPLMALKLGMAFDTTPESWLELQNQYDLWQEQSHMPDFTIRRIFPFSGHESPSRTSL